MTGIRTGAGAESNQPSLTIADCKSGTSFSKILICSLAVTFRAEEGWPVSDIGEVVCCPAALVDNNRAYCDVPFRGGQPLEGGRGPQTASYPSGTSLERSML